MQINNLIHLIKKRHEEEGSPLTTRIARQKACGKDVDDLKKIILYRHTLAGWITRRLSFGLLYVFYVFFPLSGILLVYLGVDSKCLLPAFLMWFGDISFISSEEQIRLIHSYVWVPTSLISTYGLIVCAKLSIRKIREQWCTQKVRENHD